MHAAYRLNQAAENMGSTRVLVIRNVDTSFVYFPLQDGYIAPVPAIDSYGVPTDFSRSASWRRPTNSGWPARAPTIPTSARGTSAS